MTRAQALEAAVGIISKNVADLAGLIDLLEIAGGSTRLAAALRKVARPKPIGGAAKPDPAMWREGRVR